MRAIFSLQNRAFCLGWVACRGQPCPFEERSDDGTGWRSAKPEQATVDEDGEPELGKNEVGFAEDGGFAPPAGDAERAKDGDEPQFGGGVARALHLGHEHGALVGFCGYGNWFSMDRIMRS